MQIGVDSARAVENKRVFVIDSDDVSAMALQFMLADECEAHVLPSVAAALDKGRDWPPQLILLGAGVLAIEGGDAVSRLKAQLDGVKILIVCDSNDQPAVRDALARGASNTLLRPLKLESVRRKVDAQLGRRSMLTIPVHAI
jgi:DNA-binding response OmpR family regulator